MRAILDTHTFLWFILDSPKLSQPARRSIEDVRNQIEVSPATYWEIAIKINLGKYALPGPYQEFIESQIEINRFQTRHIEPRHTSLLVGMPRHHRDPFDRLLVAQALCEGIPIISADLALDAYGVQRIW